MASQQLQNYIPETVNQFTIYRDNTRLLGVANSIDLPDIPIVKDEITGAGFWGVRNVPATGHVDDVEWELKFISYHAHLTQFGDTTQEINLMIRASEQMQDQMTLEIKYIPWVMFVRGRMVDFKPGKLENTKKNESTVTLNLDKVEIRLNDEPSIHWDKILGVYEVDGVDLIAPIRAQL